MNTEEKLKRFIDISADKNADQIAIDDLFQLFDSLEAIKTNSMLGDWQGGVFNTGHSGEQQLGSLKWVGKRFRGDNDVDPIISMNSEGERIANPVLGQAVLREVVYRGVATATMIYDSHPILDYFRKVTDDVVLGVMDRKAEKSPLFFYLCRLNAVVPE